MDFTLFNMIEKATGGVRTAKEDINKIRNFGNLSRVSNTDYHVVCKVPQQMPSSEGSNKQESLSHYGPHLLVPL